MSAISPSKAIIDLAAYAENLDVARRYAGGAAHMIAVVKANAYGHGLTQIARRAAESKAHMLGVATLNEGVDLRAAGIEIPILLMVQPGEDALDAIIEHNLTVMVSTLGFAERLGEAAQRARRVAAVHCKVDTGMGRQGFALGSAPSELQSVTRISHIDIEGIATHFPVADQPEDPYTYNQIKAFKALLRQLDKAGIPYEMAHAANSAAIINYEGSIFDTIRPGLMTYGVWPGKTPPASSPLRRVLRWETRITQVRELEPGASVGYGRTFTTSARTRVAILPIGYADGYKHALSNCAEVLIKGKRCPVRGSVSMDQITVDISAVPDAAPGDTATLIGADGQECITVEELARLANTIPYDILTGIGARVQREYIN